MVRHMHIRTMLAALAIGGTAAADLVNGSFDDGLNNWTAIGSVAPMTGAGGETVALFSGSGTLEQTFNLPAGARTLSFLYLFHSSAGQPDTHPLTDTFDAYLLDPATLEPLAPPDGLPGLPSPAFLLHNRDFGLTYDSAYVNVTDPDADGLRMVTLDVSDVTAEASALLRFQFTEVDDGFSSLLVIDSVVITVPAPAVMLAMLPAGLLSYRRRRRMEAERTSVDREDV